MPIRHIKAVVQPRTALIALALCGAALAGCAPSIDRRGFMPDETNQQPLQQGIDTKSTVLSRYGSPSTIATFDDKAWYYISYTRERRTYHKPVITQRSVIEVKFDDKDVVSGVRTYDLADGRNVKYSDRKTPTRGRELSVIEQIFGNVGRSTGLPTSDDEIGSRR